MATIEYWIQLENRPWDASPNNISRMDGLTIKEKLGVDFAEVNLTSTETGVTQLNKKMYLPVNSGTEEKVIGPDTVTVWTPQDALILRRYTKNWAQPHDHKVNPWDINEKDPSDTGTMGTIPGPTLECEVGDKIVVYFRNKDFRTRMVEGKKQFLPLEERLHSLHPHGIVFAPQHDGAYPLSPPDMTQPIGAEGPLWAAVDGVTTHKKGDRVPPGGTFTYTWDTFKWPTTAGVWHYHDHSICDVENVMLGAIGFLVIHNPNDPDDVLKQDDPGGVHGGSPIKTVCFPIDFPGKLLPLDLEDVVPAGDLISDPGREKAGKTKSKSDAADFLVRRGDLVFEMDKDFLKILKICLPFYVDPPKKAQYLQYYHEMPGVGMCINGRRFLGNTPTLIAGPKTIMRFGLAAMNLSQFHTFHLHGHRWTIPGPKGEDRLTIQNSPQVAAASQFEDTKTFGPANSFSFTIHQGSFMGAHPKAAIGEWHMHCHVLQHMMPGGMMGSLLVINGGELAFPQFLPKGVPCKEPEEPKEDPVDPPLTATVKGTSSCTWRDDLSGTPETTIKVGGTVTWEDEGGCSPHTVISVNGAPFDVLAPPLNILVLPGSRTFNVAGTYAYNCGVHGGDPFTQTGMYGIINVVP